MKKSEKIIKYVLIGIAALLVVFLIAYLAFLKDEINSNSSDNENEEETVEVNYVTYTSYDELFTIDVPDSWVEVEQYSLNENAIIELNNEDEYAYIIAVMNSKEDLNTNFDSYKKSVFEQKEELYETTVADYVSTTVDDHDAEYGVLYYTLSGINTYIRVYAIETDNYFGQIVIWTTASKEDEVQDEFDSIVESFKEIKEESTDTEE